MTSIRTRLVEKTAMPSTRRFFCPGGASAAPIVTASYGSAGGAVSLSHSPMTQVWNFMTAPCNGRFCTSSMASPERRPALKQRA